MCAQRKKKQQVFSLFIIRKSKKHKKSADAELNGLVFMITEHIEHIILNNWTLIWYATHLLFYSDENQHKFWNICELVNCTTCYISLVRETSRRRQMEIS